MLSSRRQSICLSCSLLGAGFVAAGVVKTRVGRWSWILFLAWLMEKAQACVNQNIHTTRAAFALALDCTVDNKVLERYRFVGLALGGIIRGGVLRATFVQVTRRSSDRDYWKRISQRRRHTIAR
jgi:hypothetical protein